MSDSTDHILELIKGKRLVYVINDNPCCEKTHKSHEQLIKEKAVGVTLYFIDADVPIDEIGADDWDDAPSCCNSGPPYDSNKGLVTIELRLGDVIHE